ncbi:MAG: hypothetical protein HHJ09_17145 [Glaciimonas sp.]|nr:hypothetical protein [Glaciimonas sp.]
MPAFACWSPLTVSSPPSRSIGSATVGAACLCHARILALRHGFPAAGGVAGLSRQVPGLAFVQFNVLLGALVIAGAAVSFIGGMLYKIMPFLVWFHLQTLPASGKPLPNMKAILPEKAQRRQLRLHLASVGLLIAAALWPTLFTYLAALSFGAVMLFLMCNLIRVARVYRDCLQHAVQANLVSGMAEKITHEQK